VLLNRVRTHLGAGLLWMCPLCGVSISKEPEKMVEFEGTNTWRRFYVSIVHTLSFVVVFQLNRLSNGSF
jgi:hypothetical protein